MNSSNILNILFPIMPQKQAIQEDLFSKKRMTSFIISLVQLAAILLILRNFNIEKGSGISAISPLILIAFVLNSLSPVRFRSLILFGTSIAVIYFAFGYFSGSLLIIAGLTLIACCHLPINFWFRVLLIILIVIGMAILRMDLFYAPRAEIVVPFIASMFMFRLMIYLYELKHNVAPASLMQRLSYFFLFPNHCFLLFPIIDYKTFLKTYYSKPDNELWQKGIRWMLRGIFHLMAYRIIYFHLLIGPGEVSDLTSLLQYMICSYALILRLSGMFHFILGLIIMFGFDLHPIFNNYFLATSFIDVWRRINIYWREFIMKLFFYPIMFKLKKRITTYLLPVTMMFVFIITWAMHNYQWFWIRGYFPLTPMDIIFWLTLGICITINSVWVDRTMGNPVKELRTYVRYPLNIIKMMGMFLFMSFMWSLWGSNSLPEWFYLLSKAEEFTSGELISITLIILGIILSGSALQSLFSKNEIKKLFSIPAERTLFMTLPVIIIVFGISHKTFQNYIPGKWNTFISSISEEKLNENDKENSERGYYKKLIDGENNSVGGLWEISLKRSKTFTAIDDIAIRTNDLLTRTLRPNEKIKVNDYLLETNSFGMRDKEYEITRPENTCRIALLGGSYEMGSGVNNNEIFEKLTEDELNKNNTDSIIKKYELLNFAVGGYHLIQQVELCNTKIFRFDPDAVLYVAHTGETTRLLSYYADLIQDGIDLKYPFLKSIKTLSGAKQTMSKIEIQEHLRPYIYNVIQWCYTEIAIDCHKHHVTPVWAFLPATADKLDDDEFQKIKGYALQLGFLTMDLRGVYGNADRKKIAVSEWDTHPNAQGHQMIYEKFYSEFIKIKPLIISNKK